MTVDPTATDVPGPLPESCKPPTIDPAFAAKRAEWIRSLDLKEPGTESLDRNCILAQIYDLVWNAAAFRIVQEARLIADKDEHGRLKLHGLVHHLLDRCFFHSQMSSIRKLMDAGSMKGSRGVFSLKSLVSDMGKNREMFTRRNMFAAFELAMDVEAVRSAEREYCRAKVQSRVFYIPRELDADSVEELHANFDRLSGVSPSQRRDTDVVSIDVFSRIEARLEQTKTICEHVNKFLAHAATPESRATVDPTQLTVTLSELWDAHEAICRACQFIDVHLLRRTSHSFLAMHPGNLFLYCDAPLLTQERVPIVEEKHSAYAAEIASWGSGELNWLLGSSV